MLLSEKVMWSSGATSAMICHIAVLRGIEPAVIAFTIVNMFLNFCWTNLVEVNMEYVVPFWIAKFENYDIELKKYFKTNILCLLDMSF